MMLYPAMSELLAQVPSRYQLVNVVAAKARKIASEAKRQEIVLDDKPVSIAIREVAQGDVLTEAPEVSEVMPEVSEVMPEAETMPEVSEVMPEVLEIMPEQKEEFIPAFEETEAE